MLEALHLHSVFKEFSPKSIYFKVFTYIYLFALHKMKLFWIIWFYQNNLNLDNYNPKCPCCLWRLKKDTYAMHIHTILEKSWLINVLHNPSSMIISLRPCIKFLLSYVFTTIHAPNSILHICILHLYWEPVRCRLASLCQFKLDKGYDLLAKIKGTNKRFLFITFSSEISEDCQFKF